MSKRKSEDASMGAEAMEPAGNDPVQEPLGAAENNLADRMAKARAARTAKYADGNGHKPKGADMAYVIIGESDVPPRKGIIGIRRTRGQCRKQWESVRDMAAQMYDRVYVVRGKRIEVSSL